jgi:hypothetical protein
MRRLLLILPAVVLGLVATSLPGAGAASDTTIVFNGEGNRLNAYDAATGKKQLVIHSAADAADGKTSPSPARDINAQLCFFTGQDGATRFIAGEDTGQGSHGTDGQPGWGIFKLEGTKVGELSATQVGKLKTTFQTSDNADERAPYESNPENYGCGLLSDGRVVTSDVGNQYPLTPNNGQLIVWFPDPVTGFDSTDVKHCKIDTEIPTAGGIHVDDKDRVYVASNRPSAPVPDRLGGIYRYSGDFPTSPADCEAKAAAIEREVFIQGIPVLELLTPSAIAPSGKGTFYVSSVFDGRIAEYGEDGSFIRLILEAAPGLPPYDTGTPYGIGVGPDGTLYYADLGVVVGPPPGPGDKNGTVRRIRFVNGEPQAPEIMDEGLEFPDGIGILTVQNEVTLTGQSTQAQVQGVQKSRGAVDAATLPTTGGGGVTGAAGALLLALALLVRRGRGRTAATS